MAARFIFQYLCTIYVLLLQELDSSFIYGGCHSRLVGWLKLSNDIVIISFHIPLWCDLYAPSAASRITPATFADIGEVVMFRTRPTWIMKIT